MTEEAKEKHNKDTLEKYYFYKSKGICALCGQEQAAKGKVYCLNCLDAHSLREMIRREKENPEQREKRLKKNAESSKERSQKLKQLGLCIRCGKRKPDNGYVTCKMCLYHRRKLSAKYRREQGVLPMDMRGDGYHCAVCGCAVNKAKLCDRCMQNCLTNLKKANEVNKNSTKPDNWHNKSFHFGKKYFDYLKGNKNAN